jgi:hypothetical protein
MFELIFQIIHFILLFKINLILDFKNSLLVSIILIDYEFIR